MKTGDLLLFYFSGKTSLFHLLFTVLVEISPVISSGRCKYRFLPEGGCPEREAL